MVAPAFGTIGTRFQATSASPALAVPASVASGDILVAYIFVNGTATITAMPTGFAATPNAPLAVPAGGQAFGLNVCWKRATAADTGTYTFTVSSSVFVYANVARYTGCIASGSPWDATASASNTTSGTACPAVSLTTLGPDRLLAYCGMNWNGDSGTWSPPTGWTERAGGASVTDVEVSDKAQAAAGGSGNINATSTASGATASWLGALIGTTPNTPVRPRIWLPTHQRSSWW